MELRRSSAAARERDGDARSRGRKRRERWCVGESEEVLERTEQVVADQTARPELGRLLHGSRKERSRKQHEGVHVVHTPEHRRKGRMGWLSMAVSRATARAQNVKRHDEDRRKEPRAPKKNSNQIVSFARKR